MSDNQNISKSKLQDHSSKQRKDHGRSSSIHQTNRDHSPRGRTRSHHSTRKEDQRAPEANLNKLASDQDVCNDQRGGTQSRMSSPNKQSVLVKRVMKDGRVVSGLDSIRDRLSEPLEEDIGTLGSQSVGGGKHTATNARDSKAGNKGTEFTSDGKMRSTMYITGQSQRFPMNSAQMYHFNKGMGMGQPASMIINLGDRTGQNFNNVLVSQQKPELDMLIGTSDIMTGAFNLKATMDNQQQVPQATTPVILNQKISHNKSYHSNDLRKSQPIVHAMGTQAAAESYIATSFAPETEEPERQRISTVESHGGMQIQSMSPTSIKARDQLIGYQGAGSQPDSLLLQGLKLSPTRDMKQSMSQFAPKPEMTGISVKIVDPRSLIPSQPAPDYQQYVKDRKIRAIACKNSKSPSSKPQYAKLKRFHKEQAQQYKDYIRKNQEQALAQSIYNGGQKNKVSSRMEQHDYSQSTLMNYELYESSDAKPQQMHQCSEIMMRSLEDKLQTIKMNTVETLNIPKTGQSQADNLDHSSSKRMNYDLHAEAQLETIISVDQSDNMKKRESQQSIQISQTAVQTFDRANQEITPTANTKMLKTFLGADNMKLRIIDHSVLKPVSKPQDSNSKSQLKEDQDKQDPIEPSPSNTAFRDPINVEESIGQQKRSSVNLNQDYNFFVEQKKRDFISEPRGSGIINSGNLSPFESSIMYKASPFNRIESFRALLRQESAANEMRILSNQDNFRNLINPEVTRKEYKIFASKPSQSSFNLSNVQNQKLLMRKDDMLHTVTNEFLADNFNHNQKHSSIYQRSPARANSIKMDITAFRVQLAHKIQEIREFEGTADWQNGLTRANFEEHELLLPTSTLKQRRQSSEEGEHDHDHSQFLTYLQTDVKNQVNFNLNQMQTNRESSHQKRLSLDNTSKAPLELPLLSPKQQKVAPFLKSPSNQIDKKLQQAPRDREWSTKKKGPFRAEHAIESFADQPGRKSQPKVNQRSGATLKSSSSSTMMAAIKRYVREHRIVVFEDGAEMSETTPCVVIELNSLLMKHYQQQNGASSFTTEQQDIHSQIIVYERAVEEILDLCRNHLVLEDEVSPEKINELNGGATKDFNRLYTVYGDTVTSLLQIEEDCCMLVAGFKKQFQGLKTSTLFQYCESANDMLNRIMKQSPINFDARATKQFENTLKRQMSNESIGKTFALTQKESAIISPAKTAHRTLQPASRSQNHRVNVSQANRNIIKASKAELMNHLTANRSQSHRASNSITKRLANINMATKAIKRGRLPPIKPPSQLDVFVFGEKQQQWQNNIQTIESPREVNQKLQRALTITDVGNDNSISKEHQQQVQNEINASDIRRKRGTEATLRTREQYVGMIQEQQSMDSNHHYSSVGPNQQSQYEIEYSERIKQTNVNLRKHLDTVNSIQMLEENPVSASKQPTSDPFEKFVLSKPRAQINQRNMEIAKIAIKERSPGYSNNKLVSQTSIQGFDQKLSNNQVDFKLSQRQKDKLLAETNEHVLINAIKQRKLWREEYKLDDAELFKLFSEFSSMMQINRMQINENAEDSIQNRMLYENEKTGESDAKMSKLFPMGSGISSMKYNLLQREERHKQHKLNLKDYRDFRVPVNVMMDYSEVLRPMKSRLRTIVLNAFGILADYEKSRMTMVEFLRINSFLRFGHSTDDEFMWFCVRLFDPSLNGYTKVNDCEDIIDLLFDNQDEDDQTTKAPNKVKQPDQHATRRSSIKGDADDLGDTNPPTAGEGGKESEAVANEADYDMQVASASYNQKAADLKGQNLRKPTKADKDTGGEKASNDNEPESNDGLNVTAGTEIGSSTGRAKVAPPGGLGDDETKDESVCANIKKVCYERGVFKADGFLDPQLLYEAFKANHLDILDFKSALQ